MDTESEQLFQREAGNWLSRGRASLLGHLLASNLGATDGEPRLLEVGAGFGENISTVARFGRVDALEISGALAEVLARDPRIEVLYREPVPDATIPRTYDAIIAWDVLEHIHRDELAIDWVHDHLRPGGIFVAAVPAYAWLFSDHDRAIHHYRRYTSRSLVRLVGRRLVVQYDSYFNTALFPLAAASRMAWQAQRRWRGRAGVAEKQSSATGPRLDRWFGTVLDAEARRVAAGRRAPFGLTVVCVARR